MPTVVFLSWRIVINHAVLGNILAWWSASCLLLPRFHVPLLVYYCHVSSCFASGLLLSQVRFMFTTCHVRILSKKSLWLYCLSFIIMICSSSLLLFYFLVWYSHIESARFVIVYHSCVPIHKTKRSMSQLTNPITPTDFFITEIRLSYFHNFFIFFGSIDQNCVSNDSQHISFPLLIRPHWTHTLIYICMYVS